MVGDQRHAPAALPPAKTRHPLCRRLDGPQGRSGKVRKILPPHRLDPWIVQPVASHYTEWAIPVHRFSPYFRLICGVNIGMVCELRIRNDLEEIGHVKIDVIFCIFLTRLGGTTKNFSQENLYTRPCSNRAPPNKIKLLLPRQYAR
jgi:hypothetical protein